MPGGAVCAIRRPIVFVKAAASDDFLGAQVRAVQSADCCIFELELRLKAADLLMQSGIIPMSDGKERVL